MSVLFVTRHEGAIRWFNRTNTKFSDVEFVAHFDAKVVKEGDIVIGILPMHIAAEVIARGGRFIALTLITPPELRGKELTPEEMDQISCSLREFHIVDHGEFEI